jgi:hypothetical protein
MDQNQTFKEVCRGAKCTSTLYESANDNGYWPCPRVVIKSLILCATSMARASSFYRGKPITNAITVMVTSVIWSPKQTRRNVCGSARRSFSLRPQAFQFQAVTDPNR